ncbi:MAG TPA: S9 family peptidase [Candidatus Sulfotelmatobacter sp.]|jgi:dipeptidyl aminopeptidase/acylaminoacyl peptidase|nr:S9 family peptidase [Candidatus Sulfotelmatobacter sp.]
MLSRSIFLCIAATALLVPKSHAQQPKAAAYKNSPRAKGLHESKSLTPVETAIATLTASRTFEQVAISPDAKSVAWVEAIPGKDGTETGKSAIHVSPTDGKTPPRHVSASAAVARTESGIGWSPDSKQLAFLSDAAKPGQSQLYVIPAAGGPARKLTSVKGFLDAPRWSPDGKTIALLFIENAPRVSGPLAAETPETGEIKDSFFEQRLALVDVATGKLRQITSADMYIYEYAWAPDGENIVATAARGNGDSNWYIAELFTINAASGAMKSIYKPAQQIARPVWALDGKTIAFIAGLMSDESSVGGDIFVIPATGGTPKNLTREKRSSASWLASTKNQKIVFAEVLGGDSGVASVDASTGEIQELYQGSESISAGLWGPNLSLAADGETAAVEISAFDAPPEIWTGKIGRWTQLTSRNKDVKPAWGQVKSIHWKSDEYDVQGWLVYPRDFDPVKKYPLVVNVHGGPGAAVQSSWPGIANFAMALPSAGYFVLFPNPRGSFGQGEAFTRANVKDFGYGDFRDVLVGVDEAIKNAPIDPKRLGLTGWSYGGYMTMWGVTQTDRFKAAVAGAGIANLLSYYGENKIDQWMIPFFGKSVYDDPGVYAKSSPITFIKKVNTPTLILVGDSDGECPTPQSYEFWHALKTLGVETQLVVYEHEGHHFVKPEHNRDRIVRTVAWFDAHLH